MSVKDSAIVVGAGVVGVATAYALARRGLAVTVVERHGQAGLGTSFANGAQLSYAYSDALASPAMLKRMPAILAAIDPAFRVRLRADPDFLRWGLSFLRNCTAARFRENSLAGLQLALRSKLAMAELLARHPLEFGHQAPGKLLLYESAEALKSAAAFAALKAAAGGDQRVVNPSEAVTIEPALATIAPRLAGGIWAPGEEIGDPYLFCRELLALLVRDYGVQARLGVAVREVGGRSQPSVLLEDGGRLEAGHVVICTGPEAIDLARSAGFRVPIMPVRGHSITAPLGSAAPRVSITDTARKIVFCRLGESMRVAGLADAGYRTAKVDEARLRTMIRLARESLPHAADYDRIASRWAGLRPVTPDSLPLIERRGSVTINLGHGGLGWTYAMGSAEAAARLVVGEEDEAR